MEGKLCIVPTPVGNMADMTPRAIEVLKEASLVLAEDTRTSAVLMRHFGIATPMASHPTYNEHRVLDPVLDRIEAGETIALISDAGTPGISDPGFMLARECRRRGLKVETLPGATAFVPALVSSGLPNDKFCFEGFLPQKKGRQTRLLALQTECRTMIFYESPFRILKALGEFAEAFGVGRRVSVSRELSKKFEQTVRGSVREVIEHFEAHPPKGEFVMVVEGATTKHNDEESDED